MGKKRDMVFKNIRMIRNTKDFGRTTYILVKEHLRTVKEF
jgi:hypothetical protein